MAGRRSLAERLEAERLRKEKAEQRIKALERDQNRIERAKSARREALVGQIVLRKISGDPTNDLTSRMRDWLRGELEQSLTRDTDKALFAESLGNDPQSTNAESSNTPEDPSGQQKR